MNKPGFDSPNHTQAPNGLFDLIPDMDNTELKVTLIIIRETFGWHRPSVSISLTELMKRTGLSKQGVFDGLAAGKARGTIVQSGGKGVTASYSLVVNSVDQSTQLTGQPNRPAPVNSVDQSKKPPVSSVDRTGQSSRPAPVNSVDQPDPSEAAPSGDKSGAERKTKESKKKETETDRSLPVSAEGQEQDTGTGAADAARVNTPTPPLQEPEPPKASGRAPNATGPKDGPGAAGVVHRPVDNFPEGAARPFLVGCYGAKWLGELIDEDPSRADWFALPAETFQAQKDDALTSSESGKWKSTLISLLDAETAKARRARRPRAPGAAPATSINDEIKARIAATRRAE